ncbi:hypothetical protein EBR96_08080, partial [bacterium]|nr:hypothetical protein [bacterium]
MGIDPATKQTISGAALDTTAVGMEVSDVVSLAKDMSDALGIGLGVAGAVTSAASALYLTRQLISCNDRITSLNAAATTLSFSGDEELSGILKDAVKANELSK